MTNSSRGALKRGIKSHSMWSKKAAKAAAAAAAQRTCSICLPASWQILADFASCTGALPSRPISYYRVSSLFAFTKLIF